MTGFNLPVKVEITHMYTRPDFYEQQAREPNDDASFFNWRNTCNSS